MEEKEILVSPESTYEDLKELTKKLQDLFGKHVAPGAGVVLGYAKQGNSASRLSVFTSWGENLSKDTEPAGGGLVYASVSTSNGWKRTDVNTEPRVINLSDMWKFFTWNDYLSTKNLKAVRRAEASGFEVKLSPVLLWRGREGKKVLEVHIPACGVRQVLELVFLVHVWNFLYDIGVPGALGSCPIRTHDSNRPAITGLAQGNTTVISNDMRTAGELYSEIVHLLCANDVRTSDRRINQELGLKPWEC